jgi:hypothetical protein
LLSHGSFHSKSQAPNPKLQTNLKTQFSKAGFKAPHSSFGISLEFGAFLELGAWDLEFPHHFDAVWDLGFPRDQRAVAQPLLVSLEVPGTKSQTPNKTQDPIFKREVRSGAFFVGHWKFLGIWCFGFWDFRDQRAVWQLPHF